MDRIFPRRSYIKGIHKWGVSYEERLRKINIPTLTYQRLHGDMIETYKILSEKYDPEVSKFINLRDDSNTRGHICKIYKSRAR